MFKIASAQLWVHDQEEALAFYTQKVGMEINQDVTLPELGGFRWLTVSPPGQPEVSVVLMPIPGPPMMDDATAAKVADVMALGYAGAIFLATDDCQRSYDELRGRGVEFVELPEVRPYG
ncbi:MAG: VOC family protein, partial [Acidimicrobiia bacterium]|nr:VOC family protein [Acidimicrobiia bacterium]